LILLYRYDADMNNLEIIFLRIAPDKFHFLKFILEGYDNMAVLTSINSKEGLVKIRFAKGMYEDLLHVLSDIALKIL